jgi:hypothetical protein
MTAVSARTRCVEPSKSGGAYRFDASVPVERAAVGSMLWGVATFTLCRRLEGMIGPFPSATAAEDHARDHCRGPWTVAPMLCLPLPDGTLTR